MVTWPQKGSVAKISGKEGERFEGPARVFDGEFELIAGITNKRVQPGDVVVIRYVGPKGAPGMPEMLKPTSALIGAGLGKSVAYHRWPFQRRYPRFCGRPRYTRSI